MNSSTKRCIHTARKEQSSKSYWRKLSQFLMKKGRFSGLKPIYLLNHSLWLYTCHTFSESCVTKEDHGIKNDVIGWFKAARIFFLTLHLSWTLIWHCIILGLIWGYIRHSYIPTTHLGAMETIRFRNNHHGASNSLISNNHQGAINSDFLVQVTPPHVGKVVNL